MSTERDEDPEQFHYDLAAAAKEAEVLIVAGLIQGSEKEIFPTIVLTGETAAKIIRYPCVEFRTAVRKYSVWQVAARAQRKEKQCECH